MGPLATKIDQIDFNCRTQELVDQLEEAHAIIASDCTEQEKKMLREDFNQFIEYGRYVILNTFAGGIIFLREPEVIEYIRVDFDEDKKEMNSEVKYGSAERNSRNVKYKPEVGQVESSQTRIGAVFPSFFLYRRNVQTLLLLVIAKMIKKICEHHKQESWFMKYERNFHLHLSINKTEIIRFEILA